ncbi:MAG TPA: hypothetical protein VJB59_04965 [Bdellovibrionota bacterium]|nr:hypothetical protein [Bdellovibrionota bacterium]
MKLCKLFSIHSSWCVVTALPLLAVTLVWGDEAAKRHETVSALGTKGAEALIEIARSGTGDEKAKLFNLAKKTFAYYCSSGRQARAIEKSFILPIPKLPPGTPVDEGATFKKSYQEKAKAEFIALFYYRTAFPGDTAQWAPVERPNYFLAASSETPGHVKALLDRSADYSDFWNSIRSITRMPDDPIPIPSMAYFQPGYDSPIYLLPVSEAKKLKHDMTASNFESNFFMSYFTMMIPDSVQGRIWGLKDYDGRIQAYGYTQPAPRPELPLDKQPKATLSAKAAIEDRLKLWTAYFKKFTTVKEAPSDSADVIRYQAGFDLNLFCQYGRFIGDLVSL